MITVHGYLGALSEEVRAQAAVADLVVGGRRHLEALGIDEDRAVVLGRIAPAVERLAALGPDRDAVIIASGDPLLYGIVRRLRRAGLQVTVVTAPSAVATAFARVALPWDDAAVVSAHGHPVAHTLNVCRVHPKVAVLTGGGDGIVEIATALADLERTYVLCERLGEHDEQVRVLSGEQARTLTTVAEPNVVLVLAAHPDDADMLGVPGPQLGPAGTDSIAGQAASSFSDSACRFFAQQLPRNGHLVWVAGDLGRQVGELARRNGAAVIDLDQQRPPAVPLPDLVVLPESFDLAAVTDEQIPAERIHQLTTTQEER